VYSGLVKSRPLADQRLVELLQDLLSEETLPPLDRWFSRRAKALGWSVAEQRRLWDSLRRALTRGYELLDNPLPPQTAWPGFRVILRGRAAEWAVRADQPPPLEPTLASAGVAPWLGSALEDRCRRSGWSSEDLNRFLAAQETPAPVHVRFRPGNEGQDCARRLAQAGAVEASDVEGVLRLSGGRGLESTDDWKNGLVEIQDASSQVSLVRLGLRPGQRVWDVCAGHGGKALLAAQELRGKGALVATDVSEGKLKVLKERVRRSGWQNIRLLAWDGESLPDFGPEMTSRGGFDRVIVDVPCTATGTWRRDPEARYRLFPRSLTELSRHQERLLRLGWAALKPGGRIAYVTCSWLTSEDEDIVAGFVAETGAVLVHQGLLGLPAFDANTEFTAVLEKRI